MQKQETKETQPYVYFNEKQHKRCRKHKKSNFFAYVLLFIIIFSFALWGFSSLMKIYTPKINVEVGDKTSYTLTDTDVGMEVKSIDERLKWIQMEDELPSVSVRVAKNTERNKPTEKQKQEEKNNLDEKPNKSEITNDNKYIEQNNEPKIKTDDFRKIPTKDVIALSKPVITKVYLGNYATIDDAMAVQKKISAIEPSIAPFIKSVKGHYIVQIGSFSDSERAGILAQKLRENGFYPKINYEH